MLFRFRKAKAVRAGTAAPSHLLLKFGKLTTKFEVLCKEPESPQLQNFVGEARDTRGERVVWRAVGRARKSKRATADRDRSACASGCGARCVRALRRVGVGTVAARTGGAGTQRLKSVVLRKSNPLTFFFCLRQTDIRVQQAFPISLFRNLPSRSALYTDFTNAWFWILQSGVKFILDKFEDIIFYTGSAARRRLFWISLTHLL